MFVFVVVVYMYFRGFNWNMEVRKNIGNFIRKGEIMCIDVKVVCVENLIDFIERVLR